MLVLTRRPGERIQIRTPGGEEIWIHIFDIRINKVRIGFEADPTVKIQREENLSTEPR